MTSRVSAETGRLERRRPLVVAIDGPAASGKSSTARWVARELGVRHVDSGSLYRAATVAMLRAAAQGSASADVMSEDQVLEAAKGISLVPADTSFQPRLDGADIEAALHGADVTAQVSSVAQMPRVRAWVNSMVQEAAASDPVVVDGRDMGTAVFPKARVKIFLVADPWERAKRRLVQRLSRLPSDEEIAVETDLIAQRDASDVTQTQRAPDAVLIDTTYLTQEEQVERIVALAKAAMARPQHP